MLVDDLTVQAGLMEAMSDMERLTDTLEQLANALAAGTEVRPDEASAIIEQLRAAHARTDASIRVAADLADGVVELAVRGVPTTTPATGIIEIVPRKRAREE